jgi:hypothetical protein
MQKKPRSFLLFVREARRPFCSFCPALSACGQKGKTHKGCEKEGRVIFKSREGIMQQQGMRVVYVEGIVGMHVRVWIIKHK